MSTYSLTGNTYTDKTDGVDTILAAHINELQDEVELIEKTLFGTRADDIDIDGALTATSFESDAGVTVGNTLTVTTGGATISAGGLTVTAGGVVVTAGNVQISSGTLTVSGLITGQNGLTISSGNLGVSSGTITASGDITSSTGDITATAGALEAGTTITAGTGLTVTTGNLEVSAGTITASGNITSSGGNIEANGSITAGNSLTVTTGGLLVTAGGLTVTAGGLTVTAGGLTVSADGADITGDSIVTGDLEVTGDITGTLNGAELVKISQTVAYDAFTDGGGASGYIDLTDTIPVGAYFLVAICTALTGFTGDTSATAQIGDGTTVDRYNTGTPNVFANEANGISLGDPSGIRYHDAEETVRVTVTSDGDFSSVSAGSMTIEIFYLT